MYRIKIEEVSEVTDERDYSREKTKEIYTPTVQELDIPAVIAVVNNLEFVSHTIINKEER